MLTAGSLFAGIGGICLGFSEAGFEVKWANEIDEDACRTYEHNSRLVGKDVLVVDEDIQHFYPDLLVHIDVLTAGFPCQPYSLAGNMKGLEDSRAKPMFEALVEQAVMLDVRAIFMENVPTLLTMDDGEVLNTYEQMLREAGYPYLWKHIYSTSEYGGVAQMRKRLYMVAFKDCKEYSIFTLKAEEEMTPCPITRGFYEIIDVDHPVADRYYYNDKKMLRFKRDVEPVVTEVGKFYQYRRNKTRAFDSNDPPLCPTLTASMGIGGHNVPLIRDSKGIRKLTPKECVLFQGFPEDFEFPAGMGDNTAYKQAGNSVSVPVIARIAKILRKSLEESETTASGPSI